MRPERILPPKRIKITKKVGGIFPRHRQKSVVFSVVFSIVFSVIFSVVFDLALSSPTYRNLIFLKINNSIKTVN
jgi:hypothetical protein